VRANSSQFFEWGFALFSTVCCHCLFVYREKWECKARQGQLAGFFEGWLRVCVVGPVGLAVTHDRKRARLLCVVLGMASFLSLSEVLLTASCQSEFFNP
jgi:hypothetical protein